MEILKPGDFQVPKIKRKRNRISRACTNCRSRKIKCDTVKPFCSSCKLKGLAECIYDSPQLDMKCSENAEIKRLKREIDDLKNQLANLHKTPPPPPPPSTLVEKVFPQCIVLEEKYQPLDMSRIVYLLHKKTRIVFYGATSFRATAEKLYRHIYLDYFQQIRRTLKPSRSAWKKTRDRYLKSIAFPSDDLNLDLLLSHLEGFLPLHAIIRQILLEFFDSLWFKFFPIIEKVDFMENFERVFSEQPDGSQKLVLKYKEADLSRIALVLLVLRLTLTFQYGGIELVNPSTFVDSKQMLAEYIDKFLMWSRHMTRTSLPTLQTFFILRSLRRYDPREGDGGDASNGSIYVGYIYELALTLGLNRHIDSIYQRESEAHRATLKNLWRCIIYMDALNSYDIGMSPHLTEEGFIPEAIDDNSLMFKTTMAFQNLMRAVNAVSITVADITGAIEHLQRFCDVNFDPIYTTIRQLYDLELSEDYFPLLQKVIFQTQTLFVISTLYYVSLKINGPKWWRQKNYIMSTKIGLLASIAYIDALEIATKFETLPLSSYIKNHISQLIFGLQKFFQVKFCFCNMFYYLLEVDGNEFGLYRPYSETLVGPAPKDSIIKLSKWQSMQYDDNVDPYVFRDAYSTIELLQKLCLRVFLIKKSQRTVLLPSDDPSFFIQSLFLRFSNNEFFKSNSLEEKIKSFRTNLSIDYDVYPFNGFLDPVTEKTIEEEIQKVIDLFPASEANNENGYASLGLGDNSSFFDVLFDDGGFGDWMV